MADQPITTSIDSLVKYLKEHGETDTTTLSRILSVNEGTIVDWADILEKAGMVRITYKVGKMFLSPSESRVGMQELQAEEAVTDVKKVVVENELRAQEEIVNKIRSKIETYSRTVKNAQAVFKEQSPQAKLTLDKISLLEKEANRYSADINAKHDNVVKIVETLDREISSLQADADQISKFNLDTSGARGMLDDIENKITVFNNNLFQMNDEFNKMVTSQKNQLKVIEASVRTEINVLRDTAASESKRISDYDRELKEYRKKSESQAQRTNKMRTQLLDEAVKTRDEVLAIYSAAESQFNGLNQSIKTMKDSWGLLAVFNDKLNAATDDIASLSKQLDELDKELSKTSSSLKNPKLRDQDMRKLESKTKSMRNVSGTLNKKGDKLEKDVQDLSK